MGLVKKILALTKVEPVSTIYSDHFTLELSEDFHLHFRNIRFEMDDEEFHQFYKLVKDGYKRWKKLGKPTIGDIEGTGQQIFLSESKIKAHPGSNNKSVSSDELRVELQQWADYIHIHWKWMRMEFDFEEFLQFADSIATAAEKLRAASWFEGAPRRVGKFHVACPRGRVDKTDGKDFWVEARQDAHLDHRHKTMYLEPEDAKIKKQVVEVSDSPVAHTQNRKKPMMRRFSNALRKLILDALFSKDRTRMTRIHNALKTLKK